MKKWGKIVCALGALGLGGWLYTAPPKAIQIADPFILSPVGEAIIDVTPDTDFIAQTHQVQALELPGYDEVVLLEDRGLAYATSMDGWIWEVDLAAGRAHKFVDAPLMPAGARLDPSDANIIYFCAADLYGETYAEEERVGLYALDLTTKAIVPLVIDVPQNTKISVPTVHGENVPPVSGAQRPLAFCNDLDVSADGQHIYFTEPFYYGEGAKAPIEAMGTGGTYREAISLGQNGNIWHYDVGTQTVNAVAQGFTFPDGVLVEHDEAGNVESLLVTETVKFRIVRIYMQGLKAGSWEIVQANLPGMPDGMDRDGDGRVWVGILKKRSETINKIHRSTWMKHILLRLPHTAMPVSMETAILALSPDAATPLFYAEHDGSLVAEISVVIPGRDVLYLATFDHHAHGLHTVAIPEIRSETR